MFPFEDFLSTVEKAGSLFQQFGIRHHLTGGAAGIAHGEPRMTQDADFVIDNEALAARLDDFLSSLKKSDFDFDEPTLRRAVTERDMFQLLDRVEVLKLDVYPREMIPGELDRTVHVPILNSAPLPMASREDTILSKLIWISKGSHKSRRDVRVLYRNTSEDEQAFVRQMSERFGLTGLLEEVLAEPDEIR